MTRQFTRSPQVHQNQRKRLFKEHLLQFVPLAAHIHRVLDKRDDHQAPRVRFEAELEDHLTRQEAERTLRVVTGWGRYAELFVYDEKSRRFTAISTPKLEANAIKADDPP
jgi:NitT/TauT family transport system ATP-binding protein